MLQNLSDPILDSFSKNHNVNDRNQRKNNLLDETLKTYSRNGKYSISTISKGEGILVSQLDMKH